MNIIFGLISFTLTVVGMQFMLAGQLLAYSTPLTMPSSRGMWVSSAGLLDSVFQEQGDSPDMSGREGVPPSAGSGSR